MSSGSLEVGMVVLESVREFCFWEDAFDMATHFDTRMGLNYDAFNYYI